MPAIATSDVAYSQVDAVISAPGRVRRRVKLTFPATNLLYSTGGVPLVAAQLGSGRGIVAAVKVIAITATATASMNPVWQWDGSTTSPKLVGLREAAAVADGVMFDEIANATSITSNTQVVTVEVET